MCHLDKMCHEAKALGYFSRGFHCSQSVLAAYTDMTGLSEEDSLKISCGFNTGMREGSVCGVCSGVVMVIGTVAEPDKVDKMTEDFMSKFREENGSILCKELASKEDCSNLVVSAVRILNGILERKTL